MALPFANDGSFLEQFQRAQQQAGAQQQPHDGQQEPPQLASSGDPPPPPPPAPLEEGELAGQQQHQQYGEQCQQHGYAEAAPDAHQHQYQHQAGSADVNSYPRQWQEQQAAYPQAGPAEPAAGGYQQDQYSVYPPQQHGQGAADADAQQQWQLQAQYDAYPSEEARRQYEAAQQQAAQQAAYLQPHLQQQWQQAQAAEGAGQEQDFNACDAFCGGWPGFGFKLGEHGLGYYRLQEWPPATKKSPPKAAAAAESKPKIILGNNSIVKGLAPRAGGVAKKKKPAKDADKPAYLREMEAWSRQACSKDDARRSLVK